jgi:hypothetical protein
MIDLHKADATFRQGKKMTAKEKAEPPKPQDPDPVKQKGPAESGGPKGPEPTRYNDWEKGGRCIDF